ncbi:MAG: BatD family protein [Planctomycetota bacterium]
MKVRLGLWLLLGLLPAPILAQSVRVETAVQRDRLYVGESELYQIQVRLDHRPGSEPEAPPPPEVPGLEIRYVDRGFQSNSSRVGARTSMVLLYTFTYRVTALEAGDVTIPAPTVTVDGQEHQGKPRTLQVVPPDAQDIAMVSLAVHPERVYPMQLFTVTLEVALKPVPGDMEPLLAKQRNVQSGMRLTVPFVDQMPDESIEPFEDWTDWLRPYQENQRGFEINDITLRSIQSFFENPRALFRPEPIREERKNAEGELESYWVYRLERDFQARVPGRYRFGPVVLQGIAAVESARGRVTTDNVYAVASPVEVVVMSVPEEGRPESYFGGVGRFEVSSDLVPRKGKVGDPMTLTLRVRGEGSLDTAVAPDLASREELAKSFRVYDATETSQGDGRVYTYSLRPTTSEVTELPAIELAYFDVQQGRFETMTTEPIPIEIEEATAISKGDIVSGLEAGGPGSGPEKLVGGIFANILATDQLREDAPRWSLWLIALAALFALYGLLAFGIVRHRSRHADPTAVRRRSAEARARQRLKEARVLLEAGERSAAERLRTAICGIVADTSDRPEAGLTPREVGELLTSKGVDEATIIPVVRTLEELEGARYGASAADLEESVRSGIAPTEELLNQLRRGGHLR